jgi:serine protease Do
MKRTGLICLLCVAGSFACAPKISALPAVMDDKALIAKCGPAAVDLRIIIRQADGLYAADAGGVILHPSGYVLTCYHTFAGATKTEKQIAYLHDGTELPFRIVDVIPSFDVAILKIDSPKPLPAATLGYSRTMKVKDRVMAIGNPGGKHHDVQFGTIGRISAGAGRQFHVDGAKVGPGHSGGPVFNTRGQMIGFVQIKNTVLPGVSYDVRMDRIRKCLASVVGDESRRSIRSGLTIDCLHNDAARVTHVAQGSAAQKAGILVGDRIDKFGDHRIDHGMQLVMMLADLKTTDAIEVLVRRDGRALPKRLVPVQIKAEK